MLAALAENVAAVRIERSTSQRRGRSRRCPRPRRRAGGRTSRAVRPRVDARSRAARSTTSGSGSEPPRSALLHRGVAGADRGAAARLARRDRGGARRALAAVARRGRRARRAVLVRDAAAAPVRARAAGGRVGRCGAPPRRVGRDRRPRAPALADVRAVPRACRRRPRAPEEARRWGAEAIRARDRAASVGTSSRRSARWGRSSCCPGHGRAPPNGSARCGSTRSARGSTIQAFSRSRPSSSRRSPSRGSWRRARPSPRASRGLRSSRSIRGRAPRRERCAAVVGLALVTASGRDHARGVGGRFRASASRSTRPASLFVSRPGAAAPAEVGRRPRDARARRRARSTSSAPHGWAEAARGELARAVPDGRRRPGS